MTDLMRELGLFQSTRCVFLQIHEESTHLFDSSLVDVGELVTQQLPGELPKCLALILLEPQVIPTIVLR